MPFIISIALTLILLCIAYKDKRGARAYNTQKTNWQISTAEFESKYVSKPLEAQLHCVNEEEIVRAIEEMAEYCTPNETLLRRRWLDIMLAYRGKVSSRASFEGYDAHGEMTNGSVTPQSLREQEYAFVEWVRDTLKKQGVVLIPVFVRDNIGRPHYAWLGSFAAPDPPFGTETVRRPFTKDLIRPIQ